MGEEESKLLVMSMFKLPWKPELELRTRPHILRPERKQMGH
jgi:hypothetical protein